MWKKGSNKVSKKTSFLGAIVLALFALGATSFMSGTANAAPSVIYFAGPQFCEKDGTVTVGLQWIEPATTSQRLDVSLSANFASYSSVATSVDSAFIVKAKPGTDYYARVVDANGASSPIVKVTTIPCTSYPPPGAPTCTVPQTIPSLTKADLAVHEHQRAPAGVYEGDWIATAANPNNPVGTPVGKSVVVVNDLAAAKLTYFFAGNRFITPQWFLGLASGGMLTYTNYQRNIMFTQQSDGSLKGQISVNGVVTSEGTFRLCRPVG